ncbi:75k gamma secalin [Metarhizium acridum CQMa 102]|uniref:75k gamma secalin n=1 Tax=Metarhizium acridum (strain CQMa 102) TaxID=655827 RepID=E9E7S1_METAQ|nr:75k gamma secalin [Metarhizium acridum CQMa 102]EFY88055.1 75k gamma secalin [Metarhizium acridum CQMa 102]
MRQTQHMHQQHSWPQPQPVSQQQQFAGHPSPRPNLTGMAQAPQHAQRMMQSQQSQASDHMLQRMYQQQQMQQQQAPQQILRSPQIHQQRVSPQPRVSPLLPSQMQRKHSLQGQTGQQAMQSPIQQQLQHQFQSPPPPRMKSSTPVQNQMLLQQPPTQSQTPPQPQHQRLEPTPTPPPPPPPPPQEAAPEPVQEVQEPPPTPIPEPEPEPEPEPAPAPIPDVPVDEPPLPPAIQEPINFVNPLDIFNAPPPPPLPSLPMGDPNSWGKKEPDPEPVEDSITVKPSEPAVSAKSSPVQESITVNTTAVKPEIKPEIKQEPKYEPMRIKSSPHSSVTNSPALSTKSPSITKRSPAPKPRVNTIPIMVAIAEECLEKARSSVHDVAMSLDPERVDEYQKLIATSLSCLEAVMQNNKLAPREEARLRMRYAAILHEDAENLMEAETALGKGISLCDKYLMLKVLFQRNHKAALKAVDGHISDCEAFKHVQWYYAFRLLKSTFYMAMGSASDAAALENIRAVQNVATSRGDNAMTVFASILEGLALLKTSKDSNIERVQSCIAQAAKFQFDPTVKIMHLEMLILVLDFASSLYRQSPDMTAQKLRSLQQRLDECEEWNNVKADFLIPVKKQPSNTRTVSEETSAIIRLAGEADGEFDYIVMSFMTKVELRSLVFTFSGLANMHKPSSQGRRSTEFWLEGAKILDTWDSSTAGIPYGPSVSLSTAIRQRSWRTEAQAYLNVLLGLLAASHCQWDRVKQFMEKLDTLITPSTQPTIGLLSTYLTGVYRQGTGNLEAALTIFLEGRFDIPQTSGGGKAGQQEIALLAGLNRLWIMQHPSCRNDYQTHELIEQLQPFCSNHWNIDLRTAWHNVVAALETDPPQQLNQQKQHIQAAMSGSKVTNNILGAAVTLCIMRSRFFENVIGEQALKSARAASKQAQRSGNMLWQSVADGMLAQSYEVQGHRDESIQEWEKGTKEAKDAFAGSW